MVKFILALWIIAVGYTFWKRSRQIKRQDERVKAMENHLNNFIYEQKAKEAKGKEGKPEEGSD
jgi:hypothetical protein